MLGPVVLSATASSVALRERGRAALLVHLPVRGVRYSCWSIVSQEPRLLLRCIPHLVAERVQSSYRVGRRRRRQSGASGWHGRPTRRTGARPSVRYAFLNGPAGEITVHAGSRFRFSKFRLRCATRCTPEPPSSHERTHRFATGTRPLHDARASSARGVSRSLNVSMMPRHRVVPKSGSRSAMVGCKLAKRVGEDV